jgi:hypothetical protein
MKTEEKFNLSDYLENGHLFELIFIKKFIRLIENKVLLNWKGQNEFIDWLKNKTGDKLK